VDDQFVAAVEAKDHALEQSAGGVESEAQLPGGAVVIEFADEDGVLGGVDGVLRVDSVLASRVVDSHAT
jgi:hypothetical protein